MVAQARKTFTTWTCGQRGNLWFVFDATGAVVASHEQRLNAVFLALVAAQIKRTESIRIVAEGLVPTGGES